MCSAAQHEPRFYKQLIIILGLPKNRSVTWIQYCSLFALCWFICLFVFPPSHNFWSIILAGGNYFYCTFAFQSAGCWRLWFRLDKSRNAKRMLFEDCTQILIQSNVCSCWWLLTGPDWILLIWLEMRKKIQLVTKQHKGVWVLFWELCPPFDKIVLELL